MVWALTLAAWLCGRRVRALWHASAVGRGIGLWEATASARGWLVLTVALLSPLHALGGLLLSAHMLPHALPMLVAAPLLVLGRPLIPYLRGLPLPLGSGVCEDRRRMGSHTAEDQQLGGLLMWVPGGVPHLIAALALLVAWLHAAEDRVRRGEGQALLEQPSSNLKSCIPGSQSRVGHDSA